MKKKWFIFSTLMAFLIWACNNDTASSNPAQNPYNLSHEDSVFIAGLHNFAEKKTASFTEMKTIPIKKSLVEKCVAAYIAAFGSTHPDLTGVKFTDYVAFDAVSFRDWVAKYDVFNRSRFIVVEFGIYTKEVADSLNSDSDTNNDLIPAKIGRVTAFISPYANMSGVKNEAATMSNGTAIDPLNLGSLHP